MELPLFPTSPLTEFSITTAGLDVPSRVSLTRTLQELHEARSPRIMIGLRKGEDVPAWITHVLEVEGAQAVARTVKEVRSMLAAVPVTQKVESSSDKTEKPSSTTTTGEGALLVDMRDVNVAYGARKVCIFNCDNYLVFILLTDTIHSTTRYSRTSTGKSAKASDGIFKAPTVRQLPAY